MILQMICLFFLLGLCMGSFLLVVSTRMTREESFFLTRSHCDQCHHTLAWYDLLPVVSYVLLRGTCRYCKTSLSLMYPGVEILTGLLFVATFMVVPYVGDIISYVVTLLYSLFIISCLLCIGIIDYKEGIIPDEITYAGIGVSILYLGITHSLPDLFPYVLSALGSFFFFLLIYLLTNAKGMGFGDVKLSFLLGLFLGFPGVITALYVAFISGAIVGVGLLILKKKKKNHPIPFGPFLVFGTYVSFFFAQLSSLLFHFFG